MTTRTLLAAASAAALLLTPALGQSGPSADALVSSEASAPEVGALSQPSEREGEYLDVDGGRVFYEVSGEGPAMVLLHGYPLSGALFSRVRDTLDDDFTVVTVDHRGYGNSETEAIPSSVDTYATDALAVMDEIGVDSAVIGGMSMGGPIVFSMYDMAPERFTGMVLIDTTAAAANPAEKGLWQGVDSIIAENGMAPIFPALLPDMLSGETRLNQPAVGEYLTSVMRQASTEAGRGGAQALAERPDRMGMLGSIEVPTLVLVGQEDALYAMSVSQEMVDALPQGELAIVPGASHAAVFEAPGYSGAAIQSWASRNSLSGGGEPSAGQ